MKRREFIKSGLIWLPAAPALLLPRKSQARPTTIIAGSPARGIVVGGSAYPERSSVIGAFHLDEADSANATDSGPNALTLTQNNSVGTAAGVINTSRSFSGGNKYLSRSDTTFQCTSKMSVSFWGYVTSITSRQTFVSFGNAGDGWEIENYTGANGDILFYFTTSTFCITGTAITANTFHHIAWVFDGTQTGDSNRMKCYLDGASQTLSFGGSVPSTIATPASPLFQIGRWGISGGAQYLTGRVDELVIWNVPLTSGEVTTLYNGGAGLAYS